MAALSKDTFFDLDESLSETLIQKKKTAKPKKTVLKQQAVLNAQCQQQGFFTAGKPKRSRNFVLLPKSLTSSQETGSPIKNPINCNISRQQFKSLEEIKENLDNSVLSKILCDLENVESRKSCVRTVPDMEECKYTNSEYDMNTEERETSIFTPENKRATCHLIESPDGTANAFSEEESPFTTPNVYSPNTGFIDLPTAPVTTDTGVSLGLETAPANHDISFTLSSTSFIDLETPPVVLDTSFSGHTMPLSELETLLPSDTELLKTPINFSTVADSELRSTPEMFTFKSSERPKSSLSKLRRRSTVGLRGSPETNCLIRYIAQQKSVSAEDPCDTSSPFRSGRHSSLKDKISAFRASFLALEEREQNAGTPGMEEGVSQARNLTIKSPVLKPHNKPNPSAELPSNMKKLALDHHSQPCAEEKTVLNTVTPAPCEIVQEASGGISSNTAVANTLHLDPLRLKRSTSEISSSERDGRENHQYGFWKQTFAIGTKVVFTKYQAPEQFDKLELSSGPLQHGGSLEYVPPSPSSLLKPALKKTPKNGKENQKVLLADSRSEKIPPSPDSVVKTLPKSQKHGRTLTVEGKEDFDESKDLQKKKKVTFGRDLSPEIFDKKLPANTPLRKGKTPDRFGNLSSSKLPGDALSTIQQEPIAQPNFDNAEDCDEPFRGPVLFVASAGNVLSFENAAENMSTSPSKDSEKAKTHVFPLLDCELEFIESEPVLQLEPIGDESNPLNSQHTTDAEQASTFEQTTEENTPSEKSRVTRSALKRKCVQVAVCASLVEPSFDSSDTKQKKQQNRRSQPQSTKRKLPAKTRITKPRNIRRKSKGSKSAKKVEYGPREIVSKKPLLSPIVEIPEVLSSTPPTLLALNRLGAREDHSETSDDSSEPVPNRKVSRKTRSVRGTGRRRDDSSEDSTCDESEIDEVLESHKAWHMDDSETDSEFRSLETSTISYEDQCVHKNASPIVGHESFEVASLLPSDMGSTLSAVCTAHDYYQTKVTSAIINLQEHCGNAASKEKCLSTGNSTNVNELSENIPIRSTADSVLSTDESCRRRSSRLSLQVPVSDALTVNSMPESTSITESAKSVALSRMQKLRPITGEKSQTTNKGFGGVLPEGMSSMVDDHTDVGVDNTGSIPDNLASIAAEHTTKARRKKSCRNIRRNTIFCFHPYNILESTTEAADIAFVPPVESVAPSRTDEPEDCESDNSLNIEEMLTNVKASERTVRRSMRLSRGSAVTGLSWVIESPTEKNTHNASKTSRRLSRSVNASVQKEYSPTPKIKVTFSSPDKENCEVSVLAISGRNRRRKTLCTSTLQETKNVEVRKNRRGRRSFKVDGMCSVKIELEHPFESQVNDKPGPVS